MSNYEPFSVIKYQFLELERAAPLLWFIGSKVQEKIKQLNQRFRSRTRSNCGRTRSNCGRTRSNCGRKESLKKVRFLF